MMLLILGTLPWLLILLYQIPRRGFIILVTWLLIAPIVTILTQQAGRDVVFQTSGIDKGDTLGAAFYYQSAATINVRDAIEPTRILFSAFLLILIFNHLLKNKRSLPLDRTEIWMSIFSCLLLINVFLTSNRVMFALHTAVDAFIVPFLAYYVARRVLTSESRFRRLIQVIGYMGFYIILICLIERLTNPDIFYRLRGPFNSTNTLYVVMAVVFFIALLDSAISSNCPEEKQALPRGLRRFLLLMSPVVILLNLTRGDWLGFILAIGTFLLLGNRSVRFSRRIRVIGWIMMALPLIVLSVVAFVPKDFIELRVVNPANAMGRLATWELTVIQSQKAPIFGVGLNNLHGLLRETTVQVQNFGSFNTPHNALLSIFVELGAVGLVVYLAVIASIVQMGLKLYRAGMHSRDRWQGIIVIAITVAYQLPGLFANTLYIPDIGHVYVYIIFGAIAGLCGQRFPVHFHYASSPDLPRASKDLVAFVR